MSLRPEPPVENETRQAESCGQCHRARFGKHLESDFIHENPTIAARIREVYLERVSSARTAGAQITARVVGQFRTARANALPPIVTVDGR